MSSDTHEEHSQFIKTPGQLIWVVTLAFVVFVGLAVLVSQLVTTGHTGSQSLSEEKTAQAIQPVAKLEIAAAGAAGGVVQTGEQVYQAACAACHGTGVAGAPKLGDSAAWAPRIKAGYQGLLDDAIKGKGGMPARGGNPALSDLELGRAIVYMANKSGGSLKEPAAPAGDKKAGK